MKSQIFFLALVLSLTACGSSKSAEGGSGVPVPKSDGQGKGGDGGNSSTPPAQPSSPQIPGFPGFPMAPTTPVSPAPSTGPVVPLPVLAPARGAIWNCLSPVTGKKARVSGHLWDFGIEMSLDIDGELAAPLDLNNGILSQSDTSQFCALTQIGGKGLNVLVVNQAVQVEAKPDSIQATLTRYRGEGADRACNQARGLREYDERLSMVCVQDPSGVAFDQSLLGSGFGLQDLSFADRGARILPRAEFSKATIRFAFPSTDGGTFLVYDFLPLESTTKERKIAVAKINSEGLRDSSYGVNGWFDLAMPDEILEGDSIDYVNAVTDGPNGSFFIAGKLKSRDRFLAHLNPDGQLNRDFLDRGFLKIGGNFPVPAYDLRKFEKQGQLVFTGDALYFSLPYKYGLDYFPNYAWSVSAGKVLREGILDKAYVIRSNMNEVKDVRFRQNGEAVVFLAKSKGGTEKYDESYVISYTILNADGSEKLAPVVLAKLPAVDYDRQLRVEMARDGGFALIDTVSAGYLSSGRQVFIFTAGPDGILKSNNNGAVSYEDYPNMFFDRDEAPLSFIVLSKDKLVFPGNWQGRLFRTEQPALYFTNENGGFEEGYKGAIKSNQGKVSFGHLGLHTEELKRGGTDDTPRLIWLDVRGQINMLTRVNDGYRYHYASRDEYVLNKMQ